MYMHVSREQVWIRSKADPPIEYQLECDVRRPQWIEQMPVVQTRLLCIAMLLESEPKTHDSAPVPASTHVCKHDNSVPRAAVLQHTLQRTCSLDAHCQVRNLSTRRCSRKESASAGLASRACLNKYSSWLVLVEVLRKRADRPV